MKVRFAVSAPTMTDVESLSRLVIETERLGFDTLWFSDLPLKASFDPLLAVATAAPLTTRTKLGVNLVPFGYQPYVLARNLAQLDRLTGGRLLLNLVRGLEEPGEGPALGIADAHRGRLLDRLIPQLRSLWTGQALERITEDHLRGPSLAVLPVQDPLEIWLGGSGSEAVKRAGRLADGWLGSLATPHQAGTLRQEIQRHASDAGRTIDPEHFGMSVVYARDPDDFAHAASLARRVKADLEEVVPLGRTSLREFIARLVEVGLSKFVLRRSRPGLSWDDDLAWLAHAVLDLQT